MPTAFNIMGPLVNPAGPRYQVVGVADARVAPLVVDVFHARGRQGLIVHGADGLDKFTTVTNSQVWVIRNGRVDQVCVAPEDVGLPRATTAAIRGGSAAANARTFRALLDGQPGPVRDVVLLNAAAALTALDPSTTQLTSQLTEGIARCAHAVDTGAARSTLTRWVRTARAAAGTLG